MESVVSINATLTIDAITADALPIFAHSARTFRKVSVTGGKTFEGYGNIILKDPGLALLTLKQLQANSGKPLADISSMTQATMLLGIEKAKRLPLGHPQLETTLSGYALAGYTRTACRAFHAAFQAWDWAYIKNDHAPEEVMLATLLHDVAEMSLWVNAPDKMHQFRKLMLKDHLPTDEAQYIAFGNSLEHFSREIAAHWQLPGLVNDALRPENASNPRVRGVMLAIQLSRTTERGWYWEKAERILPEIAEYLDAPLDEVVPHIHFNAVRAALEAPFYKVRHAATLLPMLPGGEYLSVEEEFPEAEAEIEAEARAQSAIDVEAQPQKPAQSTVSPPKTEATTSSIAATAVAAPAKTGDKPPEKTIPTADSPAAPPMVAPPPLIKKPTTQVCLIPQKDAYEDALRALHKGIGKMDLNELMRNALHGMHDGIGLNRVVFTLLTKNPNKLVSRYIVGSDNDPIFSRFEIKLDKPHLFTRLLEKQVSLWINDDNRAKFWPLVPESIKVLIKTNSFFAMSIFVHDKPVGLFYADRRSIDCQLDEIAYKQFRQTCQLVAKGMANLTK
ncbi:MAG: HDOD domain-containing protein [Ectothiorhodospiraceae bacterium]|nr:HDOD domain-containing protein [Ectothiorhodospiraceae bacterium]